MSGIDKVQWGMLSPLLDELLELDETSRAERLARISSDDTHLGKELPELLQKHRTIEEIGFLEGSALQRTATPSLAGQVVGNYTLDRPLGQGGMGTVWLAHRSDGRYEAHVAIKLLNLALVGPSGVDRFEREGSLLARLTHRADRSPPRGAIPPRSCYEPLFEAPVGPPDRVKPRRAARKVQTRRGPAK